MHVTQSVVNVRNIYLLRTFGRVLLLHKRRVVKARAKPRLVVDAHHSPLVVHGGEALPGYLPLRRRYNKSSAFRREGEISHGGRDNDTRRGDLGGELFQRGSVHWEGDNDDVGAAGVLSVRLIDVLARPVHLSVAATEAVDLKLAARQQLQSVERCGENGRCRQKRIVLVGGEIGAHFDKFRVLRVWEAADGLAVDRKQKFRLVDLAVVVVRKFCDDFGNFKIATVTMVGDSYGFCL